MSDRYSHRNGEIDVPTESGIYWTSGMDGRIDLTQVAIQITGQYQWRSLLIGSSWQTLVPKRAKQLGVQWYGPVVPPEEQP